MAVNFKTPFICDRRVFNKKGKWKSPNNDIAENIFYFEREPLTYTTSYENGREQFKPTCTICVFGSKPFASEDKIWLEDGTQLLVKHFTPNYAEKNVLVVDILKPRMESVDLVLE